MAQAISIDKASEGSLKGGETPRSTKAEEGQPRVKSVYRARAPSRQKGNEAISIKYTLKPAKTDALNVFWPVPVAII